MKNKKSISVLIAVCICIVFANSTLVSKAKDDKIRFAWFTDTQNLSWYKVYSVIPYVTPGTIYNSLCDKIKDDYKNKEIDYVMYTGDFVWDREGTFDWLYSESAFSILLKNNVPHGVLAGNHDMNEQTPVTLDSFKEYTSRFGQSKYKDKPWYGESFYNNIGHYDLIESGGIKFIVMYMSYGISSANECIVDGINGDKLSLKDAAIEWMNYNLDKYQDRKAILCFHDGLTSAGTVQEESSLYQYMDDVIIPNKNVVMVFSGHYINDQKYSYIPYEIHEFRKGTRIVHCLFHNYQELDANEAGYIRYIEIDKDSNSMKLYSYSPHTKKTIDEQVIENVF